MRVKWSAIVLVALVAVAIVTYKANKKHQSIAIAEGMPRIVLVADFSEAYTADACAEIIRSVRSAHDRGIRVAELSPDNKSEMLRRYNVLTVPTVLILDDTGRVISRFEGEDQPTVAAVRNQLAKLTK